MLVWYIVLMDWLIDWLSGNLFVSLSLSVCFSFACFFVSSSLSLIYIRQAVDGSSTVEAIFNKQPWLPFLRTTNRSERKSQKGAQAQQIHKQHQGKTNTYNIFGTSKVRLLLNFAAIFCSPKTPSAASTGCAFLLSCQRCPSVFRMSMACIILGRESENAPDHTDKA